ncbi:MAG TPA: TOBE domain-containing protein, partial [Chroococcidiopsis sp.]
GEGFNLGIRPEHLTIATDGAAADGITADEDYPEQAWLQAKVSVVEPLGRETLIRAVVPDGDHETVLNLQVAPSINTQVGDRLPVALDLAHLFVFDPSTGDRLDRVV